MKRILVTGGTGFIGRNLKEYLSKSYDVYAPSHSELDLEDKAAVEKYLNSISFDVVIHCANTNDSVKSLSRQDILYKNPRMFSALSECQHLYGKMLYLGSGAEYDCRHYIPKMKEDYIGNYLPEDAYGFAKYIISRMIRDGGNIYELVLFGVYGKYEQYQRRFISNNICRSLLGLSMTISQNAYYDYLYIADFCKIIEWFIEHTPRYNRYNVCTSERVTLLSLAKVINEVTMLDRAIIIKENGWKREYSGDNSRLLEEMGSVPFTDRKKAVKELVDFYKQEGFDTLWAEQQL